MPGALDDITVLDLGQVIAMPFCTMLLADMGARVIKVESRERGQERMALGIRRTVNGRSERVHAAQYRERNKRSVTLDLKQPQGVSLFKELCRKADVVCENFSVGAMARLGLAYEDIRQVNPRIVYASITAFGQNGPYAKQRGYDMLSQAISGFMSINGFPENLPTRAGPSLSDYYAGMLTAFSIVSALRYRDRTGFAVDPTHPFYTAFNLFRVAAILQGIAGRARDGVQTASNAGEIIERIEPLARAAWQAAREAGAT